MGYQKECQTSKAAWISRSGHHNLWRQRERNTNWWNDAILSCYATSSDGTSSKIVLTHHNIRQCLKLFGKAGKNLVTTELEHLYSWQVLKPRHSHELTEK